MAKRIYLDYAAATPVSSEVLAAMTPFFKSHFGNPSSVHDEGEKARTVLSAARKDVAKILRVKPSEIIFTGGATEANNIVILGAMRKKRGGHLITSLAEHPSILGPCHALEKEGYEVTYLNPAADGIISREAVLLALKKNTVLVSLSLVSGETGAIQNLKKISQAVKAIKKDILFHADVSQGAEFLDISPNLLGLDCLTINPAKIYGPKGVAILWTCKADLLQPIIFGGGQEMGIRPGTENLPAIVGAARALALSASGRKKEKARLWKLKDFFERSLKSKLPEIKILGEETETIPSLVVLVAPGVQAEVLAIYLNEKGLAVSNGSACAMNSKILRKTETIRFSFGRGTNLNEIKRAVSVFTASIREIKKMYNGKQYGD